MYVAAGMTFERYQEFLPENIHHISTIPNTPVSICEGVIALEQRHSLTEEEYEQFFPSVFSYRISAASQKLTCFLLPVLSLDAVHRLCSNVH